MTKPSFKMQLGAFLGSSIRYLVAPLFTCICLAAATLHAQAGYSAIVVSSDEQMFEDANINNPCCQDALFAMNIAKFLVPLGGTILIQAPPGVGGGQGLNGTKLKALLTGMGANVIEENTCPPPFGFFLIQPVDAIFVSGDPTNCEYSPTALVTYVNNGGHVFLELGTGCCGGATGEAATWNAFLNPFGLNLAGTTYNNICCTVGVSAFQGQRPFGPSLFANQNSFWCLLGAPCGVSNIYYGYGQDISQVLPSQSCNFGGNQGQVFSETVQGETHGLYAAMKCCPQVVLQSSISALVSGPHGTAYVPGADWFSAAPNASQVRAEPGGTASFWGQTMTGVPAVASCASNPV